MTTDYLGEEFKDSYEVLSNVEIKSDFGYIKTAGNNRFPVSVPSLPCVTKTIFFFFFFFFFFFLG